MSRTIELIAYYRNERFRFENADSTHVIIAVQLAQSSKQTAREAGFEDVDGYLTFRGDLAEEFVKGMAYRFLGIPNTYQKTGERQLNFRTYVTHIAHDPESIANYLAAAGRGNGIGPSKAQRIVRAFGVDATLEVCRTEPEKVAIAAGITSEQAKQFAAILIDQQKTENATLELDKLLTGRGFPKSLPKKLIQTYGNRAAEMVVADPFLLMQFQGVGFKKADALYMQLRKDPRSLDRLALCLWYGMNSDNSGNVWLPAKYAVEKLNREIGGTDIDFRGAIIRGREFAAEDPNHYGAIASIRTDAQGYPVEDGPQLWLAEAKHDADEISIVDSLKTAREESESMTLTAYEQVEEVTESIATAARCARCYRPLTADTVHILAGKPYGPTCIEYMGSCDEVVSTTEWLQRNPVLKRTMIDNPIGFFDTPAFCIWPEPSDIEDISDHQREQISASMGGRIGILTGSPGTGKAQPLDEPILTPTGWSTIGEIKPGDYVIHATTGLPVLVKSIHPQGIRPIFRVIMSDGASTRCCDEHLWETTTRKERQTKKRGSVRSLSEIRKTLDRGDGSPNHKIPMTSPIAFASAALPIEPYALGVMIGDAHFGKAAVRLSNPDSEIVNAVRDSLSSIARVNDYSQLEHSICGLKAGKKNEVLSRLRHLGLAETKSTEKFIPQQYLFSSIEDRISLLQGLLDTDGCTDGHNIEFSTSSTRLANDFETLVLSLGGTVTVSHKLPTYTHNGERRVGSLSWRILVKLPASIKPFRLKRKADRYIPRTKYPPSRYITQIQPCGNAECVCISIDAQDGLYVTNDFIVTHNTYTVAQLIKAIVRSGIVGLEDIGLGAPTGKAAVRLTETLHLAGITKRARTLHSHLFSVGEDGKLPFKVFIVDECSMKDLPMMAAVLRARAPGCHVLLVGDPYQLAPVGPGAPFRDLIAAGVPAGHLTKIERNGGEIVEACARIRDMKPWDDLINRPNGNLHWHESHTPERSLDDLEHVLAGIPLWDAQVLVALNDKGPLCRQEVNKRLQQHYNQDGQPIANSRFRIGDKVVCLKNSWFESASRFGDEETNAKGELYVANGELGEVTDQHAKGFVVRLESPSRSVIVPMRKQQAEGDEESKEVGTGSNWDLGYAISVHKSQGSEFKHNFILIDDYPGARQVCDASWVMTAKSRGRLHTHYIGRFATVERFCRVQRLDQRKTFLRERIIESLIGMELAGL